MWIIGLLVLSLLVQLIHAANKQDSVDSDTNKKL